MTGIDLIPADYRDQTRLRGWGRYTVSAVAAVLVLSVAGYFVLDSWNKKISVEITALQSRQQISAAQSETLAMLNSKKANFERQLSLLTGLRSGAAAPAMFRTIDNALAGNEVWFLDWDFQRAGHAVEKKPETVNTGYFIVVSDADGSGEEAWMIETHMTIKGQAQDHAALSRFVRKLFEQPEIQDVRILNTSRMSKERIVDFDLAVTVNSGSVTG
jgi:hypothetical protein